MTMLVAGIIAVVGAGISVGMAVHSNNKADAAAFEKKQEKRLQDALVANRQNIPDPYENIQDLSHMIRNPYANMAVATGAAEMQAEEADIALANTLDTLRASGSSAGGATALAQAALRSKKGIAANIQQQEAQNARLYAQGEAQVVQMQMAEKQRIQGGAVSGGLFTYGEQEKREIMELNRSQTAIDQQALNQQAHEAAMYSALGDASSSLMSFGGSYGSYSAAVDSAP